jgi:hypothetical protein
MHEDRSELHEAFIDAYPTYVVTMLQRRGITVTTVIADAIVEGVAVLDGLLTTLDGLEPIEQVHSPLELFREALRPIDHALGIEGIDPVGTSVSTIAPWDRYDLAPGSSQVLGPRAHDSHLRWGVTKAAALAPMVNRPRVWIVSRLERAGDIERVVADLGYAPETDPTTRPVVAIVDLDAGRDVAHAAIRRAREQGVRIVVHGERIDDLDAAGVRAMGASVVVTTGALLARPEDFLPRLA